MKLYILGSLLALFITGSAFAQNETSTTTEVSIERKVNHFVELQFKLANLPYSKTKLINEVFPYVDSQRSELAPNFPEFIFEQHLTMPKPEKKEHIKSWILENQGEYDEYSDFLEKLFRGVITL